MAANGKPAVSVIFREQDHETARALARAFINDPPLKVILPNPTEPAARAAQRELMFRGVLAMQRLNGQPLLGVVMDGKVVAAAVIEGTAGISQARLWMTGLLQLPVMVQGLGWSGMRRGMQLMDELVKHHPHEPHIYLNFLGVDPDFQRRHHCGSALLDHLRELAAQRPSLCGVYLETATEANVAYYQARGYEVIGELRPLGVRMWQMLQRTC
jgi:ribosomal protein S18 acetylase RimI-like enzyme